MPQEITVTISKFNDDEVHYCVYVFEGCKAKAERVIKWDAPNVTNTWYFNSCAIHLMNVIETIEILQSR